MKIDPQHLLPAPDWWAATPAQAGPLIERLESWRQSEIGTSAGGRTIAVLEWGNPEPPAGTTSNNLMSAISAGISDTRPEAINPPWFFGETVRERPLIAIQGGIHGSELTGTAASLNLCTIIETGLDARGREWPALRDFARGCDWVIVPWLNPDGVARWPVNDPEGLDDDVYMQLTHGVWNDGRGCNYRGLKQIQPVDPAEFSHLGCYFNDAGVNLQYDAMAVARQPETTAWMACYQRLKPDAVVIWHCNRGTMMGPSDYYLPTGHQHLLDRLAGAVFARLRHDGHPVTRLSWADLPGLGKPVLGQTTAVYHVSGALPVMAELPACTKGDGFTKDEALTVGLKTLEEILAFGSHEGFRPHTRR